MNTKRNPHYQIIVFMMICLACVLYAGQILQGFSWLMGVFLPILIGSSLAFIFNVPMKAIERLLTKWGVKSTVRRSLAILLVTVFMILIILGVVAIVVPTLKTAVTSLGTALNQFIPNFTNWLEKTGLFQVSQIHDLMNQLRQSDVVNKTVQYAVHLLGSLTGNISGILSNLFTILMSIFLMFAILGSKEHLQAITIRLMKVILPEKVNRYLRYAGSVMVETYDKFLVGQMTEAVIIGILVFVTYSLAGLPYAAMTGVLAGILSFVPYIGPFTACGLGALFIFTVNPLQALLSILVFEIVQLIEGNLIYPRVVGSSVGLPSLFTLAAALIGGNLFGLIGMIFFTPIFAVIYRLVREWVECREKLSIKD